MLERLSDERSTQSTLLKSLSLADQLPYAILGEPVSCSSYRTLADQCYVHCVASVAVAIAAINLNP